MKLLGKKRHEEIETIEAYDIFGCADHVICDCESENKSKSSLNNVLYNYMRHEISGI